jgi:hypothetical protein
MTTAKSGPWASTDELMWQLRDIQHRCPNSGYSFYSASCFDKIKAPIKDSLRNGPAKYPALIPAMPWIDNVAPAAPTVKHAGDQLEWQVRNPDKEPLKYVVYRFAPGEAVNLDRNDKIVSVQQGSSYKLPEGKQRAGTWIVTALDRLWNESEAGNAVKL